MTAKSSMGPPPPTWATWCGFMVSVVSRSQTGGGGGLRQMLSAKRREIPPLLFPCCSLSLARPRSHSFLLNRPPHQRRLSFSAAARGSSPLVLRVSPAPLTPTSKREFRCIGPDFWFKLSQNSGLLQWTLCSLWGILFHLSG